MDQKLQVNKDQSSANGRVPRPRGGRGYRAQRARPEQHEYRKCAARTRAPRASVRQPETRKVYSLADVLAVRSEPISLETQLVPAELLKRTVQVPSNKWRTLSEWSEKVRATSDSHSRAFKSLLNKLAPSNFDRIQAKLLLELTEATSPCFAQLLLEKGIGELKFGDYYAQLCKNLSEQRAYFKKDFLTACQVLFETLVFESTDRARLLASINFVGQLFNSKAIPNKILTHCCNMMVEQASEICFEGLCHLLGTCNWVFSNPRFKIAAQQYVQVLNEKKDEFNSVTKFKVLDLLENQSLTLLANVRSR